MPSPTEHDVIIAGAGVAGCRTALTLSQYGVRTLLLDQSEFPRWKPCAGGLTLKTRPYLPDPLFRRIECPVYTALLTLDGEPCTSIRSESPLGWMVHREFFDQEHLELASAEANVQVILGSKVREVEEHSDCVEVRTTNGTLTARVLVGADGAKSVVSRHLAGHAQRPSGFAYEGELTPVQPESRSPHKQGAPEVFFDFQTFPRGYGWVFRKENHHSAGGFVFEGKLPEIKDLYREFCGGNAWLQGAETYRARGHPTALAGPLRRLNSRRVLLAGEAGNLADPLTGEGIYYALRSGHLAGEAIADFLTRGQPLDRYGRQVRTEIQKDLRYARFFARLIYAFPRSAFHLLLRNSLLCRRFIEVGAGLRTYESLFREMCLKAPLLPFYLGFGREVEVEVNLQ